MNMPNMSCALLTTQRIIETSEFIILEIFAIRKIALYISLIAKLQGSLVMNCNKNALDTLIGKRFE